MRGTREPRRWSRPAIATGALLAVTLFGCSADPDQPDDSDDTEDPDGAADPDGTADPEAPGSDEDDGEQPGEEDPDSPPPIAEDGDTEPKSADGETAGLDADDELRPQAVTDVRVATHDGFDRVVFELVSDGGTPGWFIEYREPRAQGSGDLVEVAGGAALTVMIRPVLLPPDLPDDVETWTEPPLEGPEGGIVQEVRSGPIYGGDHQFFIGVDEERPFAVTRLSDPARVVVDIFHTRG